MIWCGVPFENDACVKHTSVVYILFVTIWSRLSRFLDSDSLEVIKHLEINYCELNLSDVFEWYS